MVGSNLYFRTEHNLLILLVLIFVKNRPKTDFKKKFFFSTSSERPLSKLSEKLIISYWTNRTKVMAVQFTVQWCVCAGLRSKQRRRDSPGDCVVIM